MNILDSPFIEDLFPSIENIEAVIEALLFVSGEPVAVKEIAKILESDVNSITQAMKSCADKYNRDGRATELLILEDSAQIVVKPEYINYIRSFKKSETHQKKVFSKAAMEILSIVAYFQPVTKNYIEQVRGIDSSYTVNMLVERGFLEEKGRLDAPGKPMRYGTTHKFLRCFGLSSLADLPDRQSFAELNQEDEIEK